MAAGFSLAECQKSPQRRATSSGLSANPEAGRGILFLQIAQSQSFLVARYKTTGD
jgi:hypothetical protein